MVKKLAVVCTGNICRSPMAEAMFRQKLMNKGVDCISAGTHALIGHEADRTAREVMADNGYDVSAHRAQQALPFLLKGADLILGLDQTHIDWLMKGAPNLRGRVFKLGKWNGNADVVDPYRKPKSAFVDSYSIIEEYVDRWVAVLSDFK